MKFDSILFPPDVIDKVLFKHGIRPAEIEAVLLQEIDRTYFEKVKGERFTAIGRCHRGYVTVIFDNNRTARVGEVVSARFSNESEKRKYKRKIRR